LKTRASRPIGFSLPLPALLSLYQHSPHFLHKQCATSFKDKFPLGVEIESQALLKKTREKPYVSRGNCLLAELPKIRHIKPR